MYFEFDDVRRIHQPYTDPMFRVPIWKAPIYNSFPMNLRRALYSMTPAVLLTEPIRHFANHANILN